MLPSAVMRVLVTGANGSLGRALFEQIEQPARFRAGVRSERAAEQIAALPEAARPETVRVDYTDTPSLPAAARGCDAIVHLVGIIKESSNTRYAEAHEESCTHLARAASDAGVKRIVYLSIVGSDPASRNTCLASRGRAERILLEGTTPTTILRVPMVLGHGDPATLALFRQGQAKQLRLVDGGRTLQQPIDARDVIRAIDAATREDRVESDTLELAGPESLPHKDLIARAAAVLGNPPPAIGSIPLIAAKLFAGIAQRVLSDPPVTGPMLGVLQHDDDVITTATCDRLQITLTPLDKTLGHYFAALQESP